MIHLSDDERSELRDTARRLLADRSSTERVRGLLDDPVGYDRGLWQSMAELGWFAIHVPEAHGGIGASYTDLAVILHELGRQVTPSPTLASAVVGADALVRSPNETLAGDVLPGVVAGETLLTAALSSPAGSYEPSQLSVRWSTGDGGVTLDGEARFVPYAHVADHIVVAAVDDAGSVALSLVDRAASGVSVEVEPTYDRTTRLARVSLDGVTVGDDRQLADPGSAADACARLVQVGAIAVVCDAVGSAEHLLEITNAYAKERFQFGRPIGSFQAVKHHLANMFTDVEAARAAAALAVDELDGGGDVRHAAAVATSFSGPACTRVAELAVQVHGGIGFTWEHDAHLFLKRIRLDEALFGSTKWHRRQLATMLFEEHLLA